MEKTEKFFKLQTLAYNNSIDEKEIEFINEKAAYADKKLKDKIRLYKEAIKDLKDFIRDNKHRKEYDEEYDEELRSYKMYVRDYRDEIEYYSLFKTKLIEQRTKNIFHKLSTCLWMKSDDIKTRLWLERELRGFSK